MEADSAMPWKQEKGLEEQRERFVREALVKEKTFGQLCREYQISRKTGYKWYGRAFKEGTRALTDRRRGPREGSVGAIEASWKARLLQQKKASQLGVEKTFCSFGPFVSGGKDSFAGYHQPNAEAQRLGAKWH